MALDFSLRALASIRSISARNSGSSAKRLRAVKAQARVMAWRSAAQAARNGNADSRVAGGQPVFDRSWQGKSSAPLGEPRGFLADRRDHGSAEAVFLGKAVQEPNRTPGDIGVELPHDGRGFVCETNERGTRTQIGRLGLREIHYA